MDRETHFDLEAIDDLTKIQKILSDNGYIANTTILRATSALWNQIKIRENEEHSK